MHNQMFPDHNSHCQNLSLIPHDQTSLILQQLRLQCFLSINGCRASQLILVFLYTYRGPQSMCRSSLNLPDFENECLWIIVKSRTSFTTEDCTARLRHTCMNRGTHTVWLTQGPTTLHMRRSYQTTISSIQMTQIFSSKCHFRPMAFSLGLRAHMAF